MLRNILIITFCFVTWFDFHAQTIGTQNRVATFEIESSQLQTTKKIWVYLPLNYSDENAKFPVIYMHDAQNLFDAKTSYSGEWNVDETLDLLKAKVIIVGIEHAGDKRLDELTPFKNQKYGGGNANNYLEFITKMLKPYIDKNYKTKSDSKNTCIFGSSLGGLTSFYAVLKYPEIFGKAGVFSPSFWINPEIYDLMKNSKKLKSKIYFLCGDSESEDMVKDLNKMETLLDRNRCYCLQLNKKVIIKDGKHNEKLWRDGFKNAYIWLF
jgi:predicted alpha/beta superfamily hydrolase